MGLVGGRGDVCAPADESAGSPAGLVSESGDICVPADERDGSPAGPVRGSGDICASAGGRGGNPEGIAGNNEVWGTCRCGTRYAPGGHHPDLQMCPERFGKIRRYFACGKRFRPPVNDALQSKCGECREFLADGPARGPTGESKANNRARKAAKVRQRDASVADNEVWETCRCGTLYASGEHQPDLQMCPECFGKIRRYCACGKQFRPPVNDALQSKCGECRESLADDRARRSTEESKADRRARNAAKVRQLDASVDVSEVPPGAKSAEDGAGQQVPAYKIRAAHGVGPRGCGIRMGNVPESRRRMPSCYADLADERKVGLSRELHEFLEGICPATCDICRSRWFYAKRDLPEWAYAKKDPPESLRKLCMPKEPREDGQFLCWECKGDKFTLSSANDMHIGPSFQELDALTEEEQMCVARVRPLVQIYSVRTGQVAYVGHVVNLEQKVKKRYDNLPPHPRELPILLISRPTREEWKIKSRRSPIVVNRERLIAAFDRLTISHSEYRGGKKAALRQPRQEL